MFKYTSAGGILKNSINQIYLVNKISRNEWGIPKGKIEEGEKIIDAAIREVKEETGYLDFNPTSQFPFSEITYKVLDPMSKVEVDKIVYFFIFELDFSKNHPTKQMIDEDLEGRWFEIDEAIDKATHTQIKEVLKRYKNLGN